eukprot:6499849-Karenia_brevis.AAC.1
MGRWARLWPPMAKRKLRTLRGLGGQKGVWQGLQQFPKNTSPSTTSTAASCLGMYTSMMNQLHGVAGEAKNMAEMVK